MIYFKIDLTEKKSSCMNLIKYAYMYLIEKRNKSTKIKQNYINIPQKM